MKAALRQAVPVEIKGANTITAWFLIRVGGQDTMKNKSSLFICIISAQRKEIRRNTRCTMS
jgi:hypothetical protein